MSKKIKNIGVFCSSSNKVDSIYKEETRKLGEALSKEGFNLVFGAGNIGLMGEISKTMKANGSKIIGVTTKYIQESEIFNPHIDDLIIVDDLLKRKDKINDLSDAIIALPGGFGTIDEITEILALKQLGQEEEPIILYNINGFWNPFMELYEEIVDKKFAKKSHLKFLTMVDNPQDCIKALYTKQTDLSKENWRL